MDSIFPRAGDRRWPAGDDGFTLIEVLVSALMLVLIAGAVASALIANVHTTADQHRRTEAQALAEQDQERLKGLSAAQLDNLSQTYTTTLDNYKLTVSSQAWYLNSTNGTACSGGGAPGATNFKTISTVSGTNAAGVSQTLATDESVISPPAGGGILAQFHDQTTSPLQGVVVSASGPDSDVATSDANGCTIFSGLPFGSYNLEFTAAGYVDPNGNASPLAATATVSSTGSGLTPPSTGNPVEMGLGGGITGQFQTSYGGTHNAQADGLSWYSAGGAGIPMASFRTNATTLSSSISTTTASGTTSAMGLFPFVSSQSPVSYTNNYQVWAGTCRQEQPPAGTDMFTVNPGSSQTGPILEPALVLTVTYQSLQPPVAPSDVKVTFNSATGSPSCTDEWGPLTAAATGPSGSYVYGIPFASSVTTGSAGSSSGLTGTVTVCADYQVSKNTYYHASTPAFTDSFTTPASQTINIVNSSKTSGQCS
jgi:Tfp pilus assembly protein PilV